MEQSSTDNLSLISNDEISLFKIGELNFSIPSNLYTEWKATFPSHHISKSLPLARLWMIANPAKAPIKNISAFLTNWLIRSFAISSRY